MTQNSLKFKNALRKKNPQKDLHHILAKRKYIHKFKCKILFLNIKLNLQVGFLATA